MKKFTETISIEVPVQSIADLLLSNMHPDFAHKENVAEAIVGRMMNDNSLTYLYNALNGYPCSVDFQIGDVIKSEKGFYTWGYWTEESIEANDTVQGFVNVGKIVEINPYKNAKLKIEFNVPNKKGGHDVRYEWVKHTDWSRVQKNIYEHEDIFGYPEL